MNKNLAIFLSFAAGAATGYFMTVKFLEQKYAQQAQEEIDSVKKSFREKYGEEKPEKVKEQMKSASDQGSILDYYDQEEKREYVHYANALGYTEETEPAPDLKPRVISPDEYGDNPEYDQISFTYYSDKTMTDDLNHAMDEDDIEETVGLASLTHFGEYEDDAVHVVNDRLKAYYEILLDSRSYADILKDSPYLAR